MASDNKTTGEEPTLDDWRALGSAEANAWTITPPGGESMTLDQHAKQQAHEKAEREKSIASFDEALENEAQDRRAMTPMTFEERVAYIKNKYGTDYANSLGDAK